MRSTVAEWTDPKGPSCLFGLDVVLVIVVTVRILSVIIDYGQTAFVPNMTKMTSGMARLRPSRVLAWPPPSAPGQRFCSVPFVP